MARSSRPQKKRQKKTAAPSSSVSTVLAYDLGGTKLAVAAVTSRGRILEQVREPVEMGGGDAGLIDQMARAGKVFLKKYPSIRSAGIASAGPLDPYAGVLLDPTNFSTDGKTWGTVPLVQKLKQRLRMPVVLENDAAAAVLAEFWLGAGKRSKNVMVLTLGTGLGTGVVANNELIRAGRLLHPEGGHMIIQAGDASAPCGCGDYGCAEAYLSGVNFAHRFNTRYGTSLSAREIADLAGKRDPRALEAFAGYARKMAVAVRNFAVLYAPEVIVLTGSFAKSADLFLKDTQVHLDELLKRRRVGVDLMPRICLSDLGNDAGVLGGAYVALHRKS